MQYFCSNVRRARNNKGTMFGWITLIFVQLWSLCSTQDETVYKFWTQSVNRNECRNPQLISYADSFLANNCDISYEDGSQILKRTLCHATSLTAALICSDPSLPHNSQISTQSWNSSLPISEICGGDGLVKMSNVGLFQDKSDNDLSENMHKILGECDNICQYSPEMLRVCSTFIRFCRVAFTPEEEESDAAKSSKYDQLSTSDAKGSPKAPNQSKPVAKKDDVETISSSKEAVEAGSVNKAKENGAAAVNAELMAASEADKKAAVERALFNTIKNTGSGMVEASNSKVATSWSGPDTRKLADFDTPTFYTAEGESGSVSEYMPWFLLIGLVVVILYALTLKKNRVIACIVEGKRPKRTSRTSSSFHQNGTQNTKSNCGTHHFRLELDDSDEEEAANTFNDAAPMLKNY